jgi:cadmium resistance protein CadD (predicted permease)
MDLGSAWDLMFRSVLVFIFFALLWLKFIDPIIPCLFGFPVPVLLGVAYFYWGWRKAKIAWLREQEEESSEEVKADTTAKSNVEAVSQTTAKEV